MASYRFIFDNDSRKTAAYLPRRRIITLEQPGLTEKASDREIVEVASGRKWIIVRASDHSGSTSGCILGTMQATRQRTLSLLFDLRLFAVKHGVSGCSL